MGESSVRNSRAHSQRDEARASAPANTPSCMNRSGQRQTHVLDVSVRRMISLVPTPAALKSTISARQTCF